MFKMLINWVLSFFLSRPPVITPALGDPVDAALRKHAKVVPYEFLRALAYSESRLNPSYELDKAIDMDTRRLPDGLKDSYWGLFQVGHDNVLADWNKRHPDDAHTPADLFDPDVNTKLAVSTLERIVRAYDGWSTSQLYNGQITHYRIPALVVDWDNPEFVRLVVAGWNSGYSRTKGVQRVAVWLAAHKIPVSHASVFAHAKQAGGTKYLDGATYRKKYNWQRKVVDRYFEMRKKPTS